MFLVKTPIYLRGLRFQILQFKINSFNNKFIFFKKKKLKHLNFYQHKFLQKQKISPHFNYKTIFFKTFFFCVNIFQTWKKYIALYKNYLGIYKLLPLLDCIKINDKINFYKNIRRFIYFMYVGSLLQLKYYKLFFLLSNIGFFKPKYAISYGTYILILKKKFNLVLIELPSKTRIWVSKMFFGFLGRNAGIYKYKEYFGKASYNYSFKKITVRSVAKNPVDHPNGGRTRGKMTFKTPWGLVAKKNK